MKDHQRTRTQEEALRSRKRAHEDINWIPPQCNDTLTIEIMFRLSMAGFHEISLVLDSRHSLDSPVNVYFLLFLR